MTCVKSDFAFSTGKVLINSNGVCFKSLRCTLFCKGLWEKHEDVSKWTEPRKSDKRLSGFFVFPRVGKCSQWHFLFFPILGKPFFAEFWFSPVVESLLFPFSVHRTPYKSFFLPFFINCTPYLSDFSRKSMIYTRIWVVFLVEQFRIVDFQILKSGKHYCHIKVEARISCFRAALKH